MKMINDMPVRELRCRICRAFITYERIFAGYIIHRCPKCGNLNEFEFRFMDVPGVRAMIDERFTIKPKRGGE
jgi:phage FluMu protein Com